MVLWSVAAVAQTGRSQLFLDYIATYKSLAIDQMQRYRIPASITLAQGLLESGAGRSELAVKGNNHFGIKCHNWTGRTVYHDDDARQECFRAYDSPRDSYEDHSRYLTQNRRYQSLFTLKINDYRGWARGLKAAGYATSPTYADRLIGIIEQYQLYEYDSKSHSRHNKKTDGIDGFEQFHPIRLYNRNYYLIAREGDTFRSLAAETGISYRKLARHNERNKHDRLNAGEIVWLKKKRSRAPKDMKGRPHIVVPGESMYSIAQKYGIRIASLYRLNSLPPDYDIAVGDRIRVR